MTTVASRAVRSSPYRDASQTWAVIVDLLTKGQLSGSRNQLLAVAGIVASCISDRGTHTAPIVVTCDGPRTRIYCLYDDDAVEGSEANEEALGFDPLKGDWAISIPCTKDDLQWVKNALQAHGTRITARDLETGISSDEQSEAEEGALTIDVKEFLKP